jgi:hypothetical protein
MCEKEKEKEKRNKKKETRKKKQEKRNKKKEKRNAVSVLFHKIIDFTCACVCSIISLFYCCNNLRY